MASSLQLLFMFKSKNESAKSLTKKCTSCFTEIPKKASKCSACHARQGMHPCCSIPLLGFLWFFFLFTIATAINDYDAQRGSSSQPIPETASDFDAYLMSKHFVEATLKSPTTAEFPSTMFDDPYTVTKEGDVYTVTSYVDAQNDFGAMIRTSYTIKVKFLGGEPLNISNWEYVDMTTQ